MRIIPPSAELLQPVDGVEMLRRLERIGRVCYKSEDKITQDSYKPFLTRIIHSGHESVIEHEKISVRVICDRGVSHELVRHRIASYSQESTRYCNYTKDKFGSELTFIRPFFWSETSQQYQVWLQAMELAERSYFDLLRLGAGPQEARSVLPNSLKTELAVTMDLREWRHFFRLRLDPASHPQMREVAAILLTKFCEDIPLLFDEFQPLAAEILQGVEQ